MVFTLDKNLHSNLYKKNSSDRSSTMTFIDYENNT